MKDKNWENNFYIVKCESLPNLAYRIYCGQQTKNTAIMRIRTKLNSYLWHATEIVHSTYTASTCRYICIMHVRVRTLLIYIHLCGRGIKSSRPWFLDKFEERIQKNRIRFGLRDHVGAPVSMRTGINGTFLCVWAHKCSLALKLESRSRCARVIFGCVHQTYPKGSNGLPDAFSSTLRSYVHINICVIIL